MLTPKDEAFLQAARDLGHLTAEQIEECRASHEAICAAGAKVTLAKLLQDKGHLSAEKISRINTELRNRGVHPNVGPYDVLTRLGAGGSATVYKAVDTRTKRVVALKVLAPALAADGKSVQRFLRGAELAAKVKHKNVAETYEVAREGTRYYIAMEFVQGTSLSDMAREGIPLGEAQALRIIKQVADALATCHAQGIIHRDVKPSNILVTPAGAAKLLDLGLARMTESSGTDVTMTGHVVGTPHFMSPEQCASSREIDGRADIYSLGATLFYAVTGRPPFTGESIYEVMKQQSSTQLPNPKQFNPAISNATHALIWRMMAKDPKVRPQTAEEVVRAISGIQLILPPAGPDVFQVAAAEAADKPVTSHTERRGIVAAQTQKPGGATWRKTVAAGIVLGVAGLLGWLLFARPGHHAPTPEPAPVSVAAPAQPGNAPTTIAKAPQPPPGPATPPAAPKTAPDLIPAPPDPAQIASESSAANSFPRPVVHRPPPPKAPPGTKLMIMAPANPVRVTFPSGWTFEELTVNQVPSSGLVLTPVINRAGTFMVFEITHNDPNCHDGSAGVKRLSLPVTEEDAIYQGEFKDLFGIDLKTGQVRHLCQLSREENYVGLGVDGAGNVYATCELRRKTSTPASGLLENYVLKVSPDGSVNELIPSLRNELRGGTGLSGADLVNSDGTIFLLTGKKAIELAPDGTVQRIPISIFSQLRPTDSGEVYYTVGNNGIGHLTAKGMETILPSQADLPKVTTVAAGSQGDVVQVFLDKVRIYRPGQDPLILPVPETPVQDRYYHPNVDAAGNVFLRNADTGIWWMKANSSEFENVFKPGKGFVIGPLEVSNLFFSFRYVDDAGNIYGWGIYTTTTARGYQSKQGVFRLRPPGSVTAEVPAASPAPPPSTETPPPAPQDTAPAPKIPIATGKVAVTKADMEAAARDCLSTLGKCDYLELAMAPYPGFYRSGARPRSVFEEDAYLSYALVVRNALWNKPLDEGLAEAGRQLTSMQYPQDAANPSSVWPMYLRVYVEPTTTIEALSAQVGTRAEIRPANGPPTTWTEGSAASFPWAVTGSSTGASSRLLVYGLHPTSSMGRCSFSVVNGKVRMLTVTFSPSSLLRLLGRADARPQPPEWWTVPDGDAANLGRRRTALAKALGDYRWLSMGSGRPGPSPPPGGPSGPAPQDVEDLIVRMSAAASPERLIGQAPAATASVPAAPPRDPRTQSISARKGMAASSGVEDTLRKLATDGSADVRWRVAGNLKTPPDVLAQLSADGDQDVRAKVAGNPNTPESAIRAMAKDKDPQVAAQALDAMRHRGIKP